MGGGPSQEQRDAAAREAALAQQEAQIAAERNAREAEQYGAIKPYAMSRINNGLPFVPELVDFQQGTSARAAAPGRADILRRTNSMPGLPSGFQQQLLADYDASRARDFENNIIQGMLMNENAKSEAARLLTNQQQIANPLSWYSSAAQTDANIANNNNLRKPGIGGVLGGILGGAAKVAMGGL